VAFSKGKVPEAIERIIVHKKVLDLKRRDHEGPKKRRGKKSEEKGDPA